MTPLRALFWLELLIAAVNTGVTEPDSEVSGFSGFAAETQVVYNSTRWRYDE